MKRLLVWCAATLLLVTTGCSKDEMTEMAVTSVETASATISLTTADDLPVLMAIMVPNYASDQTVRWFSDKPHIIHVGATSGELEWGSSYLTCDNETVTITAVAGSIIARRVIVVSSAPEKTFADSPSRGESGSSTADPDLVPIGFVVEVSDWQDASANL
jgi:outer membrane protein assembly factor BamB